MSANKVALLKNDGLHILTRATLPQLAQDEAVRAFAGGLLIDALGHIPSPAQAGVTLADVLVHAGPPVHPLLTALLALDAEVDTMVDDEKRVFPLPGYLSYRHRLPPDRFPLNLLHLPPLNPGGHYRLGTGGGGVWVAVRMDLHPTMKVTGHVRIAVSNPTRGPVRLYATEHRLDRQVLEAPLIDLAIAAGNDTLSPPLIPAEQASLRTLLQALLRA